MAIPDAGLSNNPRSFVHPPARTFSPISFSCFLLEAVLTSQSITQICIQSLLLDLFAFSARRVTATH